MKVVLVSAKSRVCPPRKIRIPQLGHFGNRSLSQLISSVINNSNSICSTDKIFVWTVSSIAYAWIQNISKVYKLLTQTQVQLIRDFLSISCWRLVSSHLNSADIVSRGFLLNNLFRNKVWFKGLNFLTLPESGWPYFTIGDIVNFDISKEEEKLRSIQFITKTVMSVYKALLYTLF